MNRLIAIALVLACTLLGAIGAFFLKRGAATFSLRPSKLARNYALIAGASLYFIGMVVYIFALRGIPLSIAYPLTSVTYLWILLASRIWLREDIDAWRLGGVALIIGGAVLLAV